VALIYKRLELLNCSNAKKSLKTTIMFFILINNSLKCYTPTSTQERSIPNLVT